MSLLTAALLVHGGAYPSAERSLESSTRLTCEELLEQVVSSYGYLHEIEFHINSIVEERSQHDEYRGQEASNLSDLFRRDALSLSLNRAMAIGFDAPDSE